MTNIEYLDRGFGQPNLRACAQCGAIVGGEDEQTHAQWHALLKECTQQSRTPRCGAQMKGLIAAQVYICDLPADHGGWHEQKHGPRWVKTAD